METKMLNITIKLLLMTLFIAQCSTKSTASTAGDKVTYSDRMNPHAKMQLPLEISWVHDKPGSANETVNVTITATAMSTMTNSTINLTFSPDLKLVSGESSKANANLAAGTSTVLNLAVRPEKVGTYSINILMNAMLNGEKIGSARTIVFNTNDYVQEKPKEHPSGFQIIEGKTDNGK
jgi:hypothetical protein